MCDKQKCKQLCNQFKDVFHIHLRMTFTQNEKEKSTDDDEKPCIVCFRPLIVLGFFSLSKK